MEKLKMEPVDFEQASTSPEMLIYRRVTHSFVIEAPIQSVLTTFLSMSGILVRSEGGKIT